MKKIFKQPQKRTLLFTGIGFLILLLLSPLYAPILLSGIGKYLVTDESIKASDAIIVLSAGIPERVLEAAELYRQGLAPKIFLTKMKRSAAHHYVESALNIDLPDEDEMNIQILRRQGVERETIFVAAEEINCTEDEARVLKPMFEAQGIQSILLVTSKYHTKRAFKIFRLILGKEIQVTPVPSRYDTFDAERWWRKREDARSVAFEYQKLLSFYMSHLREFSFMSYFLAFAISLILSLVLTPIVRKVMLKLRILDQPSESRWHRQPVALMGGIAILVSFLIAAFVSIKLSLERSEGTDDRFRIYIILIGACAIFILGFLDDLKGTYPKSKFASQVFIAFLMILFGIKSKIFPYSWLNIPLTLIWIVGLTNALNFIDNMDGLSSGVTSIAAMTIFGMSIQRVGLPAATLAAQAGEVSATPPTIALLALGLAGSCLGFLFFNFKPAKIFMGDCGSMFLGFTLATTSICAGWQHYSNPIPTLFAPIVTLSVPIFDITLVTCLRLKNGRMPWHGGKDHSSHRLVAILRGSEKGAVLVLYAIGILSGVLALVVMQNNSFFALIATGLLAIGMIGFGIKLAKVPYNYRRDI
jgi:UDP-N-acetylmuramyl pentapeptide phosphotransferase/UDP-N-acetylglucosamine-1-phosphate transferase/uncharacterized SAM-binding protein YcdF (DUF218 family)